MPDWSGGKAEEDPVVDAETWEEAILTVSQYAKDKSVAEFLDGMVCPHPEELRAAAAKAVAALLAEAIVKKGQPIKSMPDPQILVHMLCVGAMAGAVYAVTNMPNAVVKMGQEDEETNQEENSSGTE